MRENECSSILSNVSKLHAPKDAPPQSTGFSPTPVIAVEVFRNDARIVRASTEQTGGGVRGKCTEISMASIKNAKHIIANSDPVLPSIITLTYPETYPTDGRIVKLHFRALKERLRREYGEYDYFAAVEYQARGAPHFHIAISIDLREQGEIVKLHRGGGRRRPAFETHKSTQDWLFEAWTEIISGEKETPDWEWSGLDTDDLEAMQSAYHNHNAGVSWEMMRKEDGARRYLVKELSSLKEYQKTIPADFNNPGRHFLYSDSMRPKPIAILEATESHIRGILERMGWAYLPQGGQLFRDLWNCASEIATGLLGFGARMIEAEHLEKLKEFTDLRAMQFIDWAGAEMQAAWSAETKRIAGSLDYWQRRERQLEFEAGAI